MNPIGGYFELADYCECGVFPHHDGLLLNTGRNALEYILRSIGTVRRVHLPYYTCEAVLEPLKRLSIPWSFYGIDLNLEIAGRIELGESEYLVANNYFGLKDAYIQTLASIYGDHLIVDCAQAFFAEPLQGIKSFYSPRKFVGVADGGIAYLWQDGFPVTETERTYLHDSHLRIRKNFGAEVGFQAYRENERRLDNQSIRRMSESTEEILGHIDYDHVVSRRRENFAFLHNSLRKRNPLDLSDADSYVCPMVYPYMTDDLSLRQRLISGKIFVATYWPNIRKWTPPGSVESELTAKLIPLPIDQRYTLDEMHYMLKYLTSTR